MNLLGQKDLVKPYETRLRNLHAIRINTLNGKVVFTSKLQDNLKINVGSKFYIGEDFGGLYLIIGDVLHQKPIKVTKTGRRQYGFNSAEFLRRVRRIYCVPKDKKSWSMVVAENFTEPYPGLKAYKIKEVLQDNQQPQP